jgi:mono/diheme cytochrome c family protein
MNARAPNFSRMAQASRRWASDVLWTVAPAIVAISAGLAVAPANAANLDGLESPFHFTQRDGESIYHAICQGCHMPDARGVQDGAGHYPALAQNPRVGAAPYILHNVIHGRYGMPAFGPALDDAQVAAVVTYVRTHFGNHFDDAVTADDAKAARANGD